MDWHVFLDEWRHNGSQIPAPRPVRLPEKDEESETQIAEEIECEGQAFMIEYTASSGDTSCRSISVWTVKYNDNGDPLLAAFCHHRKAPRHFRVDRIDCCIDYDGEVHEPAPFLLETLGLDISLRGPTADIDRVRLLAARKRARPHAILLAGLSRCDGYLHPDELGVLQRHCEMLFDDLTLDECEQLGKGYTRLKPTAEQMAAALEAVRSEPPQILERFLLSAHELIEADGRLAPDEVQLYDQFYYELTGVRWLESS